LLERLNRICRSRIGPRSACREPLTFNHKAVFVLLSELADGADDFVDRRPQLHGLGAEFELAGLNLREVGHSTCWSWTGQDLRREPLEVRKATLASVVAKAGAVCGSTSTLSMTMAKLFSAMPGRWGYKASCRSASARATFPAA
jgi:hypothetical protein